MTDLCPGITREKAPSPRKDLSSFSISVRTQQNVSLISPEFSLHFVILLKHRLAVIMRTVVIVSIPPVSDWRPHFYLSQSAWLVALDSDSHFSIIWLLIGHLSLQLTLFVFVKCEVWGVSYHWAQASHRLREGEKETNNEFPDWDSSSILAFNTAIIKMRAPKQNILLPIGLVWCGLVQQNIIEIFCSSDRQLTVLCQELLAIC